LTSEVPSNAAAGTATVRLVFVDDSRQSPESLVDFVRVREHCCHIWLQHHDRAACRITRSIFVGTSVTEIVLWKDLVPFDRAPFSFLQFFLHKPQKSVPFFVR
jgi:hypothetical protein